jgi:hypothetical protein
MKKIIVFVCIAICTVVLYVGVVLSIDYFHNRFIGRHISEVKIGMSESEVVDLLGEPVRRHMTDSQDIIWCYTAFSFDNYDENCGTAITMSPSKVVHVYVLTQ